MSAVFVSLCPEMLPLVKSVFNMVTSVTPYYPKVRFIWSTFCLFVYFKSVLDLSNIGGSG